MASEYCNLPDDLIEEVLRRLPGKSLVRFHCLSKEWSRRISKFKYKPTTILLYEQSTYFQSNIDDESVLKELHMIPWDSFKQWPPLLLPLIVGSCNGLLLLMHEDSQVFDHFLNFFIWNPITEYYSYLLTLKLDDDDDNRAFGFCYDACNDDYKVLVEYDHQGEYGCVVVGSSKAKTWKYIDSPFRIGSVLEGPVLHGRVHWRVHWRVDTNKGNDMFQDIGPPNYTIVYFDPTVDKFNDIPMPKPKHGESNFVICGLGVLDGNLCMVRWYQKDNYFEIMVMKEYGIQESWMTLFTMPNLDNGGPCFDNMVPLCFTESGVLIHLVDKCKVVLVVYNPLTASFRKMEIVNHEPMCAQTMVARFEPTLISPSLKE